MVIDNRGLRFKTWREGAVNYVVEVFAFENPTKDDVFKTAYAYLRTNAKAHSRVVNTQLASEIANNYVKED